MGQKRKNNIKYNIPEGGSGMSRAFLLPHISLTGQELLDSLKIRDKLAYSYENGFTDDEIYIALYRCKHLLNTRQTRPWDKEEYDKVLSDRQNFCSNTAIQLIMQNSYNHALHEFEDCIDDYGNGLNRFVSANEFVLYNCILNCFMARLEEQSENPEELRELAIKCIKTEN